MTLAADEVAGVGVVVLGIRLVGRDEREEFAHLIVLLRVSPGLLGPTGPAVAVYSDPGTEMFDELPVTGETRIPPTDVRSPLTKVPCSLLKKQVPGPMPSTLPRYVKAMQAGPPSQSRKQSSTESVAGEEAYASAVVSCPQPSVYWIPSGSVRVWPLSSGQKMKRAYSLGLAVSVIDRGVELALRVDVLLTGAGPPRVLDCPMLEGYCDGCTVPSVLTEADQHEPYAD